MHSKIVQVSKSISANDKIVVVVGTFVKYCAIHCPFQMDQIFHNVGMQVHSNVFLARKFKFSSFQFVTNCNKLFSRSITESNFSVLLFFWVVIIQWRKHLLFLRWKFCSMLSKQSWLCSMPFKITCHLVRFHSLIYSLRSSRAAAQLLPYPL